jgi:hypothetical protein
MWLFRLQGSERYLAVRAIPSTAATGVASFRPFRLCLLILLARYNHSNSTCFLWPDNFAHSLSSHRLRRHLYHLEAFSRENPALPPNVFTVLPIQPHRTCFRQFTSSLQTYYWTSFILCNCVCISYLLPYSFLFHPSFSFLLYSL